MSSRPQMNFFDRFLTVWVLACMAIGILVGKIVPAVPAALGKLEVYQVSLPITLLLWLMIYPMLLKIDFQSIKNVGKNPKGLLVTWVVNWLVKPLTMYGIAALFFFVIYRNWLSPELAQEYLAGAVLLGAAPCTAMVFVWSKLTSGNGAYTLVQVASNDLIILVLYVPIVSFLLKVGDITIPWGTLLLSIVLYIVIPLVLSMITRKVIISRRGQDFLDTNFIPKFDRFTMTGLLATLILIFSFQGEKITAQPVNIVLIAIPLILQTLLIFALAFVAAYLVKLPYNIAAPCGLIGASNFFELAVAVAIAVFGLASGATLATVVGVLVEVPVMLLLVRIANACATKFPQAESGISSCSVASS